MQEVVDYSAFLELQRDDFVLDPVAEKKKKMRETVKRMAEIDAIQKQKRRKK